MKIHHYAPHVRIQKNPVLSPLTPHCVSQCQKQEHFLQHTLYEVKDNFKQTVGNAQSCSKWLSLVNEKA